MELFGFARLWIDGILLAAFYYYLLNNIAFYIIRNLFIFIYLGISIEFSVGNFTATYSHDETVIISSYPFSITCLVGSIEDFVIYNFFIHTKGSTNYAISRNIYSHSLVINFDEFSGVYNGQYSCGAIDGMHPNITITLNYDGSGLFHIKYLNLMFFEYRCENCSLPYCAVIVAHK